MYPVISKRLVKCSFCNVLILLEIGNTAIFVYGNSWVTKKETCKIVYRKLLYVRLASASYIADCSVSPIVQSR